MKTNITHRYPLAVSILSRFYDTSSQRAAENLRCITNDDVIGVAERLGVEGKDIKKLKAELEDR